MTLRTIPTFVLARATVSLYPADVAGNPVRSQPIWAGARQEGLRIPREIEELQDTPTGAAYDEFVQTSELSEIHIDRVWVQNKAALGDYDFRRGRFVMEIQDRDPVSGIWGRWTGYGCQAKAYEKRSNGVTYLVTSQVWRAQRWKFQTGRTGETGEEIAAESSAFEQACLFTHDDPVATGDRLIGAYQFPVAVRVGFAKVIAQAAGSPVTLALEIAGVASAHTLTIPGGSGEVTDDDTFDVDVDANQLLRWKVTSGSGAALVGLTLMVQEQP